MKHLPNCDYLLVEAQSVHEGELIEFCKSHPRASYVLAAAGDTVGNLYFDAKDPLGGSASLARLSPDDIVLPATTLDHEVRTRGLVGPFVIKFDTHGFELPILRGAKETLQATEFIVMECYNFKLSETCLLFGEMCEHMRGLGFRCIDLADPLYRPGDGVLWQMDLVFARTDRPEFRIASYE